MAGFYIWAIRFRLNRKGALRYIFMNRSIRNIMAMAIIFSSSLGFCGAAWSESYRYALVMTGGIGIQENTVLGYERTHRVQPKETLLDIARIYGLGFNELTLLYPEIDPWVPKVGEPLKMPTTWVLPPTKFEEVVINIPEMRLYIFLKKIGMVKTYPIAIGRESFETPLGVHKVVVLEKNPTWVVPPSAKEAYPKAIYPPGPDNPLGDYWVGLSAPHVGIHGTNNPWAIGRRTSRGCIRMYPEHIKFFFNEVNAGTKVEIIYEPVKIGVRDHVIYLEVHPDMYNQIPDIFKHTEELIRVKGLWGNVEWNTVYQCLKTKSGIPVPIGTQMKGGDV
ncbi:MAG: L,D-transpeptidase family protein [Desulfobacteraceae bacterium]|nr:L,D-transpeptidase family protein [Desulfobacteraceae bacterium]